MAEPQCALKESLEVNARNAVAYEKGLKLSFRDPKARKDALGGVELASLNLKSLGKLRRMPSAFVNQGRNGMEGVIEEGADALEKDEEAHPLTPASWVRR